MKIPMHQSVSLIQKFMAVTCRGDFELGVVPELRDQPVELRRRVTVALALAIWVRKDQINRDAHQRRIGGEEGHLLHLAFEWPGEVGSEETGAGDILGDVARDSGIAVPGD